MNPLSMFRSAYDSHVCQRRASSLAALLVALLVLLLSGRAQALVPGPRSAPEACIADRDSDYQEGDQHFAIITVNDMPNCSLRNAYRQHPILGQDGQPLEIQDWLRSVYAANQGKTHTVRRGCIELPNHQPPAGATIEEKLLCKDGMVNYYGITSGPGWKSYIYIPTTQWFTEFELKAAVAKHACEVLERVPNPTDEVNNALRDCHRSHVTPLPTPPEQPSPTTTPTDDLPNDVPTLKRLVKQGGQQLRDMKRQVEELKLTLVDATRSRPFRFNAWSVIALGLVLGGAGAQWQSHRSKKGLTRRIGQQKVELERLVLVAEKISLAQSEQERLRQENGRLATDNQALQTKVGEQAAVIAEQAKADQAQQELHMGVVRTLRERHDKERTGWHQRLDHLNGQIKQWKEAHEAQATRLAEQKVEITRLTEQHQADRLNLQTRESYLIELAAQVEALQAQEAPTASITPPAVTSPSTSSVPSSTLPSVTSPPSIASPVPYGMPKRHTTQQFPPVRAAELQPSPLVATDQLASSSSRQIGVLLHDIFVEVARRFDRNGEHCELAVPDEDMVLTLWQGLQSIRLVLDHGLLALIGVDEGNFLLTDMPRLIRGLRFELPPATSPLEPVTGRTLVPGPRK